MKLMERILLVVVFLAFFVAALGSVEALDTPEAFGQYSGNVVAFALVTAIFASVISLLSIPFTKKGQRWPRYKSSFRLFFIVTGFIVVVANISQGG